MTPEPSQANIERAIEMLNEARLERWPNSAGVWELPNDHDHPVVVALARALDAHDADRRAMSEVAKRVWVWADHVFMSAEVRAAFNELAPFILPDPEPVDPLAEKLLAVAREISPEAYNAMCNALAKHNLEIRSIGNG